MQLCAMAPPGKSGELPSCTLSGSIKTLRLPFHHGMLFQEDAQVLASIMPSVEIRTRWRQQMCQIDFNLG